MTDDVIDRPRVTAMRAARRAMSPAEQKLWLELRKLGIEGTHFRRKVLFGPFMVDFLCHGARVVIDLDGVLAASRDDDRQRWIEARGYKVLHFATANVLSDPAAVAQEILVETKARLRIIGAMREFDPFTEKRPHAN